VGADALAPEHLIFLVEQDDADVRAKAFPVKHNQTSNSISCVHYARHETLGKWAQTLCGAPRAPVP
jgi:hypothetical protein